MMKVTTALALGCMVSVAALATLPAAAAPRTIGINTGLHAQALNQIYRANQRNNAEINSVQRNINASMHR